MDTWYIWKKEWHGFSYSVISGYYTKKIQSKDVEYRIKFLCCSTNFSNPGRQRVRERLRSRRKELIHAKRKKKSYAQMELAMKKKVLSDKAIWYKSMDAAEKEELLSHRAE